jgi:uncharacterized protein YndB with AHSA1/START domain
MGEWSIRREIVIDAPIDVVWEFVATPEQISRWWCAGLPVELVFEQREGSHFEEHYDDGELAYDIEGTVWAFKPAERLAIRRMTEGSAAPADLVDITLSKKDEGTRVVLDHSFENLPEDRRQDMEEFFAGGWTAALQTLREAVAPVDS